MSITNLEYLKTVTDGDKPVIRQMIEIFVTQIPEFIQKLNELYHTGQYAALGLEAHKIKSSLLIMGMKEMAVEMKELQIKTIQQIEPESYPIYILHFETQFKAAMVELEAVLASL